MRLTNCKEITKDTDMTEQPGYSQIYKRLAEYEDAEEQGRLIILPFSIEQSVWVIAKCKDIEMLIDNDYTTGTGAIDCPFESQCKLNDCESETLQIFETQITSAWLDFQEAKNSYRIDYIKLGICDYDIGKTVFLNRSDAEAALVKQKYGE